MVTLADYIRQGWQVEGPITDEKLIRIGYMLRRRNATGLWERAKYIIKDAA